MRPLHRLAAARLMSYSASLISGDPLRLTFLGQAVSAAAMAREADPASALLAVHHAFMLKQRVAHMQRLSETQAEVFEDITEMSNVGRFLAEAGRALEEGGGAPEVSDPLHEVGGQVGAFLWEGGRGGP